MFTDTDSLAYMIQTDDLYMAYMIADEDLFDFSDHICFSNKNKKVIGKMKDKLNGIKMQEFIGLKTKMYSVLYDNTEMKKAKGVKKNVIKQKIRHANYRECIYEYKKCVNSMNMIRSEKHKVFTIIKNKTTLSAYDDKRYR